jgi:hypothetical protein
LRGVGSRCLCSASLIAIRADHRLAAVPGHLATARSIQSGMLIAECELLEIAQAPVIGRLLIGARRKTKQTRRRRWDAPAAATASNQHGSLRRKYRK